MNIRENKLTRRQVVKAGLCVTTGLMFPWKLQQGRAAALTPFLSDPATQPKFVEVVPNALDPGFIYNTSSGSIKVGVSQIAQQTGLLGVGGGKVPTLVWGYGTDNFYTWPGRTFEVNSDSPLEVEWQNRLGGLPYLITGDGLFSGIPVLDTSLHWAFSLPGYSQYSYLTDGVPLVPHLHGGHSDSIFDGNPEYFFGPNFNVVGPRWVSKKYLYKNDQPAGTLWYHDHTLGITRLNVYAGLAGFYILRDAFDTGRPGNPLGLPTFPYEAAFAIQDRMFKNNGELFYPAFPGDPAYDGFITDEGAVLPPAIFPGGGPTALAEFFGDHMLVNGKIWPKMKVERRNYRLRLLNGCDSRFLAIQFFEVPAGEIDFTNAVQQLPFTVVGSDQGLASSPTTVDTLLIETGSRYDIVVDFKPVTPGNRVIMKNVGGDEPFGGDIPGPQVFGETDRIMAFDAVLPLNAGIADVSPTGINFGPVIPAPTRVRQVALFEGRDEFGRLQPLLGTAEPATDYRGDPINWPNTSPYSGVGLTGQMQGSIAWHSPTTENPALGSTELWEIYNATGDAHPIHLHLTHFEVLGRQEFTADVVDQPVVQHNGTIGMGFRLENIALGGPVAQPAEYVENTSKDMVTALPGQVTRIKMTFDKPGRYVWHCHILSHEDHEMMRVLHIGPGARGFVDFCAYAFVDDVKLDEDAVVDDNLGAAGKIDLRKRSQVINGTVISTGDEVKLDDNAVVGGDAVALKKIDLKSSASVAGTKYPFTAATPPLPVNFTVTPGIQDIKVKSESFRVLAPGVYKKLNVEDFAELTLQSGSYVFEEFKVDHDSVVFLDTTGGPIVVEVKKQVELKDRVGMVLLGSSQATDVLFLGTDDVKLGKQGSYVGTFLAPYGNVELADDAVLGGALYGKKVGIKMRARVDCAPAVELVVSILPSLS